MSNVKSVVITALIPFHWIDVLEDGEKSFLATAFLSPSIGLTISFREAGFQEHESGKTAMYVATIRGHEALRWEWFDHLRTLIEKVGEVGDWIVEDIEA